MESCASESLFAWKIDDPSQGFKITVLLYQSHIVMHKEALARHTTHLPLFAPFCTLPTVVNVSLETILQGANRFFTF